jgi:transposase InsO family protein
MSTNQAVFPIASMARVLGVSTAGYHAWRDRPPSAHAQADAALLKQVRTVHASSRQIYGAPRIHAQLRADGARHGCKRIARLMRQAGLIGACHRHGGPTTTRRDKAARPAPDLVDRNFTAKARNQLWVADITFVPTAAGFLYLAVVLDAWSRKIVGEAAQGSDRVASGIAAKVGQWPIICGQNSCWTHWRWPSGNGARAMSFIIPTRAELLKVPPAQQVEWQRREPIYLVGLWRPLP